MTSPGLDAIATDAGTFAVLAMDQRGTLKRMLAAVDLPDTTDEEIVAMKRDMIASLAGSCSAFLVDPTYGIRAARQWRRARRTAGGRASTQPGRQSIRRSAGLGGAALRSAPRGRTRLSRNAPR